MFLDLKNIGPAGFRFDKKVPVPDLEGACGEKVGIRSAELAGDVQKAPGGFDLDAKLRATVETECSRCLEPVALAIDSDVQLLLVPLEVGGEREEEVPDEIDEPDKLAEIDEEEEALQFECPEGRCDLVQLVSEQIYLALPLKPVCREGCKGLCPQCGVNRNAESCDCKEAWIDPRLAPLQQLRDHLK